MRAFLIVVFAAASACSSVARDATPPAEDGVHAVATPPPPDVPAEPTSSPDTGGATSAVPSSTVAGPPESSALPATSAPPATTAQAAVSRSRATAALDKIETENGEVPDAEKKLKGRLASIEKCVNDAGGIEGKKASLVFQFIVRAAGKIEGIDVEKVQGLPPEGVKCVVEALKRKEVGPPSSDPVGVKVTLVFTPHGGGK